MAHSRGSIKLCNPLQEFFTQVLALERDTVFVSVFVSQRVCVLKLENGSESPRGLVNPQNDETHSLRFSFSRSRMK